jgi:hypothetical protein
MATEIEAINTLLVARGLTEISDPDSGHPDVSAARSILNRHKKYVQSIKWWFNTESGVTLAPNPEGFIFAPFGVHSLDNDQNYIIMAGKLYNVVTRTNVHTDPVADLVLIYDRDWEDLPVQAYEYVVCMAKEEFIRPLESNLLTTQAEKDCTRTKVLLDIADYRFKDVSKGSNPLMQKWLAKMLQR